MSISYNNILCFFIDDFNEYVDVNGSYDSRLHNIGYGSKSNTTFYNKKTHV